MEEKQLQIESWINDYTDEMLSWTKYKISDLESAKDIVQETFLSAFKSINNFKRESNPKTWLFAILNNKIADYYRIRYRKGKDVEYDSLSNFFDANGEWIKDKRPKDWNMDFDHNLLDDFEFIEILNYCIKNLPDKFNTVIQMKYYGEKSSKEICQEIGISTTNFWQMMHRAKLRLRDCLENNWFKNEV